MGGGGGFDDVVGIQGLGWWDAWKLIKTGAMTVQPACRTFHKTMKRIVST